MTRQEKIIGLKILKSELRYANSNYLCIHSEFLYISNIITQQQNIFIQKLIKKQMKINYVMERNYRLMYPANDKQSRINWIDEQIKLLTNNKKKS